MSGFIRVKPLRTRYEVGCEVYWDETEAVSALAEARGPERSNDFNLTIIRRWKVKRTEVTEERFDNCVNYRSSIVATVTVSPRFDGQWSMKPLHSGTSFYPTREEAETAARKWLRDNGYRVRKVATKQEPGR